MVVFPLTRVIALPCVEDYRISDCADNIVIAISKTLHTTPVLKFLIKLIVTEINHTKYSFFVVEYSMKAFKVHLSENNSTGDGGGSNRAGLEKGFVSVRRSCFHSTSITTTLDSCILQQVHEHFTSRSHIHTTESLMIFVNCINNIYFRAIPSPELDEQRTALEVNDFL